VESGLTVSYAYYPDELNYAIDSDCKIIFVNVLIENCIFIDNIGSIANNILIEEDLLSNQLI
jgi:hypothetical protein